MKNVEEVYLKSLEKSAKEIGKALDDDQIKEAKRLNFSKEKD